MKDRPAFDLARFFFVLALLFVTLLNPGGAQTINWTKYDNTIPTNSDTTSTNGRIPWGTAGKGDSYSVANPSVIKDGSSYKMWYAGYNGTNTRIYHATSSNGLEWTKYDNTIPTNSDGTSTGGRIPLGTAGKGDANYADHPSVIKDGSTYKMWYSGQDGSTRRIYYATSSNGLDWTKYDNTIPANSDGTSTNGKIPLGSPGRGDDFGTLYPFVLKDDSPPIYKMWYVGNDQTNYRIYYATSSNGLEWTKYTNAVPANSDSNSTGGRIPLGSAGKGDADNIAAVAVLKDGSTYKMWYTGYAGTTDRVYHATSSNGLEWTKLDNTIPPNSDTTNSNSRLGLGTNTKGDDSRLAFPSVVYFENGMRFYKMWYGGHDGTYFRIYHATFQIPFAGTIFTFR